MFGFESMIDNIDERRVARTETPYGFISTVRVPDGVKPYETAVEDSRYADLQTGKNDMLIVENYDDYDAANAGHTKWCEKLMVDHKDAPPELVDCGNGLFGLSAVLQIKYTKLPEL